MHFAPIKIFWIYITDYTKKFSEISPQLERELIPRIHTILEQRELYITLKLIWDSLSNYHKNGWQKWKDGQLNNEQKKLKQRQEHITNRLSEVFVFEIVIFSYF